jgi:cell division protein FtsB
LQNKYSLTLTLFLLILLLVDRNSLWTQYKLNRAKNRLEAEKKFYEQQIQKVRQEASDFDHTKERLARERYFLRDSGEDVFVIEQPTKSNK